MAEIGFGMLLDVRLKLAPGALVVPDLLADAADWNDPPEGLQFVQGSIEPKYLHS